MTDNADHNIENYKGDDILMKEKLFDDLHIWRNKRRTLDIENNVNIEVFKILTDNNQNLKHIQNVINRMVDKY
jgi:hypothetical protein